MRTLAACALVALVATPAAADAKKQRTPTVQETVLDGFTGALIEVPGSPKFAFTTGDALADPPVDLLRTDFEIGFWITKSTVGLAGDGRTAWVSAHMAWAEPCGDETCPRVPRADGYYQGSMLLEDRGGWKPVAWHVATPIDAKIQAKLLKDGHVPAELAHKVRGGAEDVVALFEGSIGDPKALARTVSTRADVSLFGSDLKERYVGGKKVAATLAKWNLAFKVRDGVQAGVSASGNVAWVAANLDATSAKRPTARPTPYRGLFVYEKSDAGWKLVLAHFSM